MCNPGYAGKDCAAAISTDSAHGVRERRDGSGFEIMCMKDNCSNHGDCMPNGNGEFICNCYEDYTGPQCSIKLTFNSCEELNCSSNSVCKLVRSDALGCLCSPGYTGDLCETPIACLELNCSENGICSQRNDTHEYFCECNDGFEGQQCAYLASTMETDIYEYTSMNTIMTTVFGSPDRVHEIAGVLGAGIAVLLLVVILVVAFTTLCRSKKKGIALAIQRQAHS